MDTWTDGWKGGWIDGKKERQKDGEAVGLSDRRQVGQMDGLSFMSSDILSCCVRSPDPFVKIQLVHGLKLVKTKKTSFLRGTIDPFYNESFSFKVPQEQLENASLVFTGRSRARP